jgi:hypothetical protein
MSGVFRGSPTSFDSCDSTELAGESRKFGHPAQAQKLASSTEARFALSSRMLRCRLFVRVNKKTLDGSTEGPVTCYLKIDKGNHVVSTIKLLPRLY